MLILPWVWFVTNTCPFDEPSWLPLLPFFHWVGILINVWSFLIYQNCTNENVCALSICYIFSKFILVPVILQWTLWPWAVPSVSYFGIIKVRIYWNMMLQCSSLCSSVWLLLKDFFLLWLLLCSKYKVFHNILRDYKHL